MAAPTPNEVSEASVCFACLDDKLAALLYLLNQIRLQGGGSAMTPNEIAEAAVCFGCISDKWAAALYLLANGGGGGGGGTAFMSGSDLDPNGSVTADVGTIYVSAPSLGGDGSVWYKITGVGTDTGWEG